MSLKSLESEQDVKSRLGVYCNIRWSDITAPKRVASMVRVIFTNSPHYAQDTSTLFLSTSIANNQTTNPCVTRNAILRVSCFMFPGRSDRQVLQDETASRNHSTKRRGPEPFGDQQRLSGCESIWAENSPSC